MSYYTDQPKATRQPYMGEENPVYSMCYKKHRRHQRSDVKFVPSGTQEQPAVKVTQGEMQETIYPVVLTLCKHCKQIVYTDQERGKLPLLDVQMEANEKH